eukprot:CAMPEP_0176066210 /NCGR_PEP_ID=MMETSP0120_2-20121206/33040_1 /TAXON_ID=160619 /ORGANISM="Kryptoperidinium foliaceum, Strain CCMP 1326" /LENGTH=483 /DNA_ID=CAMNT_0017399813 /DNA_START=93 /DNA_END=1544 /DNA_ORIENTATION=+
MTDAGDKKVSRCAYVGYYFVLFFAYWFGVARFDVDGDGDFDPTDVQEYLKNKSVIRKNNRVKKPRSGSAPVSPKSSASGEEGVKDAGAEQVSLADKDKALNVSALDVAERQDQVTDEEHDEGAGDVANVESSAGGWWDRDGDGHVGLNDLVETKTDGPAAEDIAMQNIMSGQVRPWFILLQCCITVGLWAFFAVTGINNHGEPLLERKAGLDSFFDGKTDLRIAGPSCEDLRAEAWRWLTYQFTHIGATHVLTNAALNVILGLPLEGLHGIWRMALMYNAGVLGGALCNFVADGHTAVVGCSGGCYALIGIQLADLAMNWRQKKFRLPTVVFLLLLIGIDIVGTFMSQSSDQVSHAAHIGGGFMGLLVGVMTVRNLKKERHEWVFMGLAIVLTLAYAGLCLGWLFSQSNGPQSIFEAASGELGWCWHRQVYNKSFLEMGLSEVPQCVRCGNQPCIDYWSTCLVVSPVSASICRRERGWFATDV